MSRRIHPSVSGSQPFQLAERARPDGSLLDTPEGRERVEMALSRYPEKRAALLPLLSYAQEMRGWVSPSDMEEVARALDLTPAYVHSIATFYTMYNKHPVGRYLIQVCTCIACHLNGGEDVLEAFLVEVGARQGETSGDGEFTVIEAECLGACGFATAVQINDEYFEDVTPEKTGAIVAELRSRG